MLRNRSVALSLVIATCAVLGAGCQSRGEDAPAAAAPAAADRLAADNTAEVCDAFRHFEVDHRDQPGPFDTIAAADLGKLADRATDPAVAKQLRAVATQVSVLARQSSGQTYDQVALANPEVFAAGGAAWVALEGRCGKAIIPTA